MTLITTTLAAACTADATTIRVTSATGFAPQQVIQIGDEILAQSGAGSSGTTISVRRGLEGTIPAAHASGATVSTGGGADFASPPPGETVASTQAILHQQVTVIPHAQILTLPTTEVVVVPAAGATRTIVPVMALVHLNTTAGAYSVGADTSWMLMYASFEYISNPVRLGALTTPATTQLLLACPYVELLGAGAFEDNVVGFAWGMEDVANQAVMLCDEWGTETDYTGGHAANTATVTVTYLVYDVAQKRFV